jgi:hypothetical protein
MPSYPARRLLAALLAAFGLAAPALARAPGAEALGTASAAAERAPRPPSRALDADGDGIDDAREATLLQRHAPLVLLDADEHMRPASVAWTFARAHVEVPSERPRVMQASVLGAFVGVLLPDLHVAAAHLRVDRRAHRGSADRADWIAYGHAFRAPDGGVLLQYWFYYPFNEAWWAFDHEGDWEHVTVRLDAADHPMGAWYARHEDAMPGRWIGWAALSREGDHPVVLSARGTHASYASPDEAPFWERVCQQRDPARAAAAGCQAWRTWEAPGGVVDLGERAAPRAPFVKWPGRWGSTGGFGREGAGDAPEGPAFQPGWCSEGARDACP